MFTLLAASSIGQGRLLTSPQRLLGRPALVDELKFRFSSALKLSV